MDLNNNIEQVIKKLHCMKGIDSDSLMKFKYFKIKRSNVKVFAG